MDSAYSKRLSPIKPPSKSKRLYSERFIPLRIDGQDSIYELSSNTKEQSTYEKVLKNEILSTQSSPNKILQYSSPPKDSLSPYSKSLLGEYSQKLLSNPKQIIRKISRSPLKVLEAPSIHDDFYLHLVDWSSRNILAVALESSVYLWNAATNRVDKLCTISGNITSVRWTQRGTHLAVGCISGTIDIYDISNKTIIRTYKNHATRVGTLDWSSNLLSSGSRDRTIYHRDVRSPSPYCMQFKGHRQEVCGIKWSPDGRNLASGGNDNQLLIWDRRNENQVLWTYSDHQAAVKAIAWSPHKRGLLVSGGGTADRCIRFRNVLAGSTLNTIDAGSQVCNIAWSKNVNELVSTHGYSQNQIVIWNYPSMTPLATLTGHTMRVLYLSISPDGTTIVTGAGDETLRFWNVFPTKEGISNSSIPQWKGSRIDIR